MDVILVMKGKEHVDKIREGFLSKKTNKKKTLHSTGVDSKKSEIQFLDSHLHITKH